MSVINVLSKAIYTALQNKQDKIEGKSLSTNDYTTSEKTKLAGIESGAEVNVNADWSASSGDAQILNKPTNVSAFTNDAGYTAVKTVTINIATSDWSNNTCTKSVADVTSSSSVIVGATPGTLDVAAAANVRCTAQGSGTLTFTCSDTPESAVTIIADIHS